MKKAFIGILIVLSFTLAACINSSVNDNSDSTIVNSNTSYSVDEQFEQLFAGNADNNPSEISTASPISHAPANFKAPARVDWSSYATPVRNQGVYQTCTAFASIAAIEIQENIKSKTRKDLDYSEIDLFYRSKGKTETYWKTGGLIKWCLESAKAFNGYCKETDCPYTQIPKVPTFTKKIPVCRNIVNYAEFNGADNMKYYLQNGPIVCSMTLYYDLGRYRGTGVYKASTKYSSGGHAVCVVGYDDNEKCWIIKNSWGTGWGNNGYGKIGYGEAKIEQYQSYAVVTK